MFVRPKLKVARPGRVAQPMAQLWQSHWQADGCATSLAVLWRFLCRLLGKFYAANARKVGRGPQVDDGWIVPKMSDKEVTPFLFAPGRQDGCRGAKNKAGKRDS